MYDVTNPEKISYANYINSRLISCADIAGDEFTGRTLFYIGVGKCGWKCTFINGM